MIHTIKVGSPTHEDWRIFKLVFMGGLRYAYKGGSDNNILISFDEKLGEGSTTATTTGNVINGDDLLKVFSKEDALYFINSVLSASNSYRHISTPYIRSVPPLDILYHIFMTFEWDQFNRKTSLGLVEAAYIKLRSTLEERGERDTYT